MERKYRITIPEPCHEDWNKMTPNENGRFCTSCVKTVVDFTTMLPEEVQHFFIKNQNRNICGRMRKSQLDSITILVPSGVLYSQTQYHKMFLLALFIAMGTTLFSCADKNGNKQKIDKIEVVEEIVSEDNEEEKPISLNKTITNKDKHKANCKSSKHILNLENDTVLIKSNNIIEEDNTVYGGIGIEMINPEYIGGLNNFYSFIKENYKIPHKLSGDIQASFVIGKDGSLNEVLVKKGLDPKFDKELIRVLNTSPKWLPAEIWGKKTSIPYILFLSIKAESIQKWYGKKTNYKIDFIEAKIDTVKIENKKISI
jgi:hypothetical protein